MHESHHRHTGRPLPAGQSGGRAARTLRPRGDDPALSALVEGGWRRERPGSSVGLASLLAGRGRRRDPARSPGPIGEEGVGEGPEPAGGRVKTLVVDASVWVSAADGSDSLSGISREFLSVVVEREIPIALPEYAELEIACALARRLRDAARGLYLAGRMLESPLVTTHSSNRARLRKAVAAGTLGFLRSGDALYAALAEELECGVVAWDGELVERTGALTPGEWLARNT
ncbi:MAG: PIN domain-containing protein [Gemmatimonadetes bacterium]|nr:PIN domain-containing protein [Gemmatimonadota bacterium]MYB99641.1 PIN domain-containing protein [Gemmatimonadota bacterium]